MGSSVIEAQYPISFREEDAKTLGRHLKNRHSVVLIGIKRVGISNFLRFFLNHKGIAKTYINDGKRHLFIPVDLNDLVEREVFPFWTLTLKRIVDGIEKSSVGSKVKEEIEDLFLNSIQSQDLFLTIENVRRALVKIVAHDILPTLFYIRFDRLKNVVSHEFFGNLQGLKDATHQKLSYVFTSFRSLDKLSPSVFSRASLSVFSQDMYIKPATKRDIEVIYRTYRSRYKIFLSPSEKEELFEVVDGYVQYLQLGLILLHEKKSKEKLFERLVKDERIRLQSEELWESLENSEQEILRRVSFGFEISEEERKRGKYLWNTGMISDSKKPVLFSLLFDHYVKRIKQESNSENVVEFSRKENLLYAFLDKNRNELCEREKIIEAVWPEVESLGVSDWAIDRLVARVRSKLKLQKGSLEIQTVKTRGYKLIEQK